jgi:anti-anti-sigma regulatory factor
VDVPGLSEPAADPVITIRGQSNAHLTDLRWRLHSLILDGATGLVADMSLSRRMTSTTLATLLYAHRRCRARGGGVTIRGADPATVEFLRRHGLHRVFRIENPRAEALLTSANTQDMG